MSQKPKILQGRASVSSNYSFSIADKYAAARLDLDDSAPCLSEGSRKALQKIEQRVSYPAGAIIFIEGQVARGVYILCRGQVKLSTTNSDGWTLIPKIAQPGEDLGLSSVISGRPYELTAEILQPAELAFISRTDFLRLITEHGDACLHFASHLSRDCQSAYDLVRSIGLCQSVSERLAGFLLQWSSTRPAVEGSVGIRLGLTHEEIAQLIGTSRETVTRTLTEFKKQRHIELSGSTLVLRDKPALENLAADWDRLTQP